jgi:hypothetical protein
MDRGKLLMTVGALVLAAAAPGFAGEGTTVRADVPFAFYAGEHLLPPGNYLFVVDEPGEPGLLTIQERNGKEHEMLLTVTEHRAIQAANGTRLVFDRYGKDNFLSQIWVAGFDEGRAVPKSEVERDRVALLRHETLSIGAAGPGSEN